MRRWDLIVDGSVLLLDSQLRSGAVTKGLALQDENLVAALLRYFHLPLRRFPGVAYLGCCNASTPVSALVAPPAGGRAGKKKAACFSKACVTRRLPSQSAAAATCTAAAAGPADRGIADVARSAMATGSILTGKYRSEVEVAVQHALALGLPGAEYRLTSGVDMPESRLLPNACRPAPKPSGLDGASPPVSQPSVTGSSCAQGAISVPAAQRHGFRVLLSLLKKRAFRAESPFISWR